MTDRMNITDDSEIAVIAEVVVDSLLRGEGTHILVGPQGRRIFLAPSHVIFGTPDQGLFIAYENEGCIVLASAIEANRFRFVGAGFHEDSSIFLESLCMAIAATDVAPATIQPDTGDQHGTDSQTRISGPNTGNPV